MPRPPGSDPNKPAFHCPTCGCILTFHNTRTEADAKGHFEVVDVYLCIRHGFFRVSKSKPLAPGM